MINILTQMRNFIVIPSVLQNGMYPLAVGLILAFLRLLNGGDR